MENTEQERFQEVCKALFLETIEQQSFIRALQAAMDDRMFAVSNIVASLMNKVYKITSQAKGSGNDDLTVKEVLDDLVRNLDKIINSPYFEQTCKDLEFFIQAIEVSVFRSASESSLQYLKQKQTLLSFVQDLNGARFQPGAMYKIKNQLYIIGSPCGNGADYWIHKKKDFDNLNHLPSLPSLRLSELMPLEDSDLVHQEYFNAFRKDRAEISNSVWASFYPSSQN